MKQTPQVIIPSELLPRDGRFGSGPSKVRQDALDDLAGLGPSYMGTSHRRDGVRGVVDRLQQGLRQLFGLPSDWEVILGVGGATLLWDALTFGFIQNRSQHLSFGEFGAKFAAAVSAAPHLGPPMVITAPPGEHPQLQPDDSIDTYAFPHNETSTGVSMPVKRPNAGGLVAVDATSAAGALRWDPSECDLYYFSPQKCFAADGGLFIMCASPAAVDRIDTVASEGRWIPAGLALDLALSNSRKNQTYNTPALATIYLTMHQTEWYNDNGGIDFAAGRSEASSSHLYSWASAHPLARPFVENPSMRSNVVVTIDFDEKVPADELCSILRSNGIVDTEGYRKLGRNQLRIAAFPAIDPSDVEALTSCIDYVVEALAT